MSIRRLIRRLLRPAPRLSIGELLRRPLCHHLWVRQPHGKKLCRDCGKVVRRGK